MQTLAMQSNLKIRGFSRSRSTTKRFTPSGRSRSSSKATYHNLGLFLDRVSKFPRIINVGNMSIVGQEKPEPTATSMNVKCTATTFVLSTAAGRQEARRSAGGSAGEEMTEADRHRAC